MKVLVVLCWNKQRTDSGAAERALEAHLLFHICHELAGSLLMIITHGPSVMERESSRVLPTNSVTKCSGLEATYHDHCLSQLGQL